MGDTQDNFSKFIREQKEMTNQASIKVSNDMIGYSKVWEGKPSDFITVIKLWSHIPEDYLKTDSAPNPSNIVLMVANEYIDWPTLRMEGRFTPIRQPNNWMRDGIGAERSEYKSKLEKEAEERRNP